MISGHPGVSEMGFSAASSSGFCCVSVSTISKNHFIFYIKKNVKKISPYRVRSSMFFRVRNFSCQAKISERDLPSPGFRSLPQQHDLLFLLDRPCQAQQMDLLPRANTGVAFQRQNANKLTAKTQIRIARVVRKGKNKFIRNVVLPRTANKPSWAFSRF